MNNLLIEIDKLLDELNFCIGTLVEALNDDLEVNLTKSDIFNSISTNISKLDSYNKQYLGEIGVYLSAVTNHLNKTFKGKTSMKNDVLAEVKDRLKEISILKEKINSNNPYNRFFENLKSIYRNLNNIKGEAFLTEQNITKIALANYDKIIIKYKKIISEVNELRSEMLITDYDNLKLDLDINYSGFIANLKEIYLEILKSNNEIAEPLLNKQKINFVNGKYDLILNDSMIHKIVYDYNIRKKLIENLDVLIESLNSIINRYKNSKIDKNDTKIDLQISNENKKEDYSFDIPQFIEDNYNEHRDLLNEDISNTTINDKNIISFIKRFEILKRKLERKKVLSKEEVKIYNKLESELEMIKSGISNKFISSIKFNYYYNALNKKLKLEKNNNFKKVIVNNKKRK